jgi:hypothetical protein
LAAIPIRPAWRDSDPRWRRRMLAGAWILALLPLLQTLTAFEWTSDLHVPNVFGFPGTLRLDETFLCSMSVYESLIFCIGVVLLFSKERGRQCARLDWTRRWGVACSYIVLLLSAAPILFISALVVVGIAALLQSMPLKYQPKVTHLFVQVGWVYLHYGPQPNNYAGIVLVAFSSIAILFACVPLFNALRSSGPKWVAMILLAPLVSFSLTNLARAGLSCLSISSLTSAEVLSLEVYFRPYLLVSYFAVVHRYLYVPGFELGAFLVEATKWCIVLAIAIWLSIVQLAAWRQGRKTSGAGKENRREEIRNSL